MNSRTILIIDDDGPTRLVLADLVRRAGNFVVIEAEDGATGIRAARDSRPDLVLLDVMMPGQNGYEVCRALRADPALSEIPIIVLSAAMQENATVAALEAGADDFMGKPPNFAELKAKVATIARLNRFRALAHERERLRWLLDHSREPLIVGDAQGKIVFANGRAREVFGIEATDGHDVVAAVGRHFHCEPTGAWEELRARGFRGDTRFAIVQPENEFQAARWFDVETQMADGARGEVLFKFTDQSGRVSRDLETWAFQHQICHKIRTPLNGLGTALGIVAERPALAGDADARALLEIARDSAERLEGTLLDILTYHELVFCGKGTVVTGEPAELDAVIRAALTTANLSAVHLPASELFVTAGTAAMLGHVFGEVFENYAKFSSARRLGLSFALEIQDATTTIRCFAPGKTPPPEVLADLGRAYWQIERRPTGEIAGTGLGLATVRALLRSNGGNVRFVGNDAASGLTTIIELPHAMFVRGADDATPRVMHRSTAHS